VAGLNLLLRDGRQLSVRIAALGWESLRPVVGKAHLMERIAAAVRRRPSRVGTGSGGAGPRVLGSYDASCFSPFLRYLL